GAAAAERVPAPARVEQAVDAAVARYDLPGIAGGVVEDGEVVAVVTRGELAAGSGQPGTPEALCKIASTTRAMTAAMPAPLVDRCRLRWDDPVTRHLPDFRMHGPWVTQQMRVRDLLIHNSGLPLG